MQYIIQDLLNKYKKYCSKLQQKEYCSLSELKVQKLSLERYFFKSYMFVPQNSMLVP